MNPLDRIQSYHDDFTKTDEEIANYVLNHAHDVATLSIDNVAEKTNSSKSAVVRFTQKIGFKGYSEFRFELSRYLVSRNNEVTSIGAQQSPVISIPEAYSNSIMAMQNQVSLEQALRIANMIRNARKIKIIGSNRTYHSAKQFKQRLGRIGYDAEAMYDRVEITDAFDLCNEKDVVIFFTVRGNGDYDAFAKDLYQKHTNIIVITMNDSLPYFKQSTEYVVLPKIDSSEDLTFLDNQVLFFVYIEILLNVLVTGDRNDTQSID